MSATVRTAKKWQLGREILHMITTAGITQAEAAKLIESSPGRMNNLIDGKGQITPGDLILLATQLGFDDPGYHAQLREMRRDYHKRGFWSTGHNRAYGEDLRLLVDLEKYADKIRVVEVEVVPGLLQCEAYARAMHADTPVSDAITLDDLVQARLARQEILNKANPPMLHLVLSESCIRRQWGDREVMREQIEYLIALSDRPNVHLKLMPFNQPPGRRSPIANPFALIRLPSAGVAGPLELAYTEGENEIRYLDDKKFLTAYDTAWERMSDAALRYAETRKFLEKAATDFT